MKIKKKLNNLYDLTNKRKSLTDFIESTLNKTLSMFEYQGLQDTLNATILEKQLQTKGYTVVFKYKNNLYSTVAGLSGQEKSPYGLPTQAIVNIPAFNLSKVYTLGKDAVLIKNDDMQTGLIPIISKRGTQMLENEITMLLESYLARFPILISGGVDQTINSAETFINKIIDGNLSVVAENNFLQDLDVKTAGTTAQENYHDLIEYQQYIKSDLYNELGLSSLNTMKKERMNVDEVNANNDNIYPFIDNMLKNRMKGIEKMNKLFNGKITVDLGSTWKDKANNRNTPNSKGEQKTEETLKSMETDQNQTKQTETNETEQNQTKQTETDEKEEN